MWALLFLAWHGFQSGSSHRLFIEDICSDVQDSIQGSPQPSYVEQNLSPFDPGTIYTSLFSDIPLAFGILGEYWSHTLSQTTLTNWRLQRATARLISSFNGYLMKPI